MSNIKLLRDPGFIYDLFFLFNLKFNTKSYIDRLNNGKSVTENTKYCNSILEQFGEIPEDLFVFFNNVKGEGTLMTSQYFVDYKHLFADNYSFSFLQSELRNKAKMIRNVIRFYLYDLNDSEVDECIACSQKLFANIKSSNYSDVEKMRLYEFFHDPDYYMELLQYELMQKEVKLGDYYKNNYQKIIESYNNTTVDILKKASRELGDYNFIGSESEVVYSSFCLLSNYLICFARIGEDVFSLLGCDYVSAIGWSSDKLEDIKLDEFGNSIGDISRAKILWFIHERGEATCKDLEKEFDFSGSTAYHHITLMTRVGVLKTRNEGKTVYYSINRGYFDTAISVLNMFSTSN